MSPDLSRQLGRTVSYMRINKTAQKYKDADGVIKESLEHGGYISITRGVSMRPLLRTGKDVVTLVTPTREIKKYDVVLYRLDGGKYLLHRVVGVRDDVLLIRGDNTFRLERVPREAIIAVLIEFKRSGRRHSVLDRSYIIYSRLWNFIYPVRWLLHMLRSALAHLYHSIKGSLKRSSH